VYIRLNVKQTHNTRMEAQGKRMYISYSFSTSALDGGEWSASRPGRALAPGKEPWYPLYRRLGAGLDTEVRGKSFRLCR
jgi:hypothetical protein